MVDAHEFLAQFQDHLAPRLDVYEQAIYLYIVRHSRLEGKTEVTIGFKSARKKMAFGVGTAGSAPSEATIYEKLRSLQSKGCIRILASERTGTRMEVLVPSEMPGVIPIAVASPSVELEQQDFFSTAEGRNRILARDGQRCFYFLATLDKNNYVIEHVVSRPVGNNSYRNVVAACRQCNNRKNSESVEDYLRTLYREGLLSADDFKSRLVNVERLRNGELRPP